jgi:hypothetical protein
MKKLSVFLFAILVFPVLLTLFYIAVWRMFVWIGAGPEYLVGYVIFVIISSVLILANMIVYGVSKS